MPKKENLLQKLCRKPIPKNFTKSELDILMKKCGCEKYWRIVEGSVFYEFFVRI